MTEQLPFASIIVVTYNRGKGTVTPCVESLKDQIYPKDRYEIIVVDDGSVDDTAQVATMQGIVFLKHDRNRGNPAARNTGLAAAKGEIAVYIDDDAVADPHWLGHLMRPFASSDVIATGGQTFAYKLESLTERYLAAIGYGNPAQLAFGKSKNPLSRFFVYVRTMFTPFGISMKSADVEAVFGLNCAFRVSALQAIGGFDETLLANQDTEICTRLRMSGARIVFVPEATIRHRHRERFWKLVHQTYQRAEFTLIYYNKEHKFPPIFPMPILYALASICLLFLSLPAGLAFVVFGPVLVYPWWFVRGLRERQYEYILFGYIQLALESSEILGMLRAKVVRLKTKNPVQAV